MEISKNSISVYSGINKAGSMYIESNVEPKVHMWFDYYPKISVSGKNIDGRSNRFTTIIRDGSDIIYTAEIHTGMFSNAFKRGAFDCIMEAYDENGILVDRFSMLEYFKSGKVCVSIDSASLGDNIAWVPYIEEFRKKYEIQNLIVTTFYNDLFEGQYENITFRPPGYREDGMSVIIGVGWYQEDDRNMHRTDPRTIPLQRVSSDILAVDYAGEIRPLINKKINPRPTNKKYVCIATESTAGAKYWHYPGGWQRLVDLLKMVGYEVVLIQKEPNSLSGVIDRSGDIPIENRVSDLLQCEFFIGLSSGLSWLSWALGVPTAVISGFTDPFLEFSDRCLRIINRDVCNGCFTKTEYKFDRGDWWWCPVHKGTDRYFECTRTIKPEDVFISILDWIESDYTKGSN